MAAGIFKVSVSYTGPSGTFLVPFTVPGQGSSWYPYTSSPLAAGSSVTFAGKVTLPAGLEGDTVSVRALADSCAGDEFMPTYCRVAESNEGNNESAPVSVPVPITELRPLRDFVDHSSGFVAVSRLSDSPARQHLEGLMEGTLGEGGATFARVAALF